MRVINLATTIPAFIFSLVVITTQVQAGPLRPPVVERRKVLDVYVPRIISPNATTEWTAGAVETVIWDTSDAPASISNQGHVVLQHGPHLAGPFNLTLGQIDVTVPEDLHSGTYKIILFGNSGNDSPAFWIHGLDTDSDSPPADSEGSKEPNENWQPGF